MEPRYPAEKEAKHKNIVCMHRGVNPLLNQLCHASIPSNKKEITLVQTHLRIQNWNNAYKDHDEPKKNIFNIKGLHILWTLHSLNIIYSSLKINHIKQGLHLISNTDRNTLQLDMNPLVELKLTNSHWKEI